jgi:NMD protein affecting ribosome stability and mRNA decay
MVRAKGKASGNKTHKEKSEVSAHKPVHKTSKSHVRKKTSKTKSKIINTKSEAVKITHPTKHNNKTEHKQVHKRFSQKFCPNCGNEITDDNTLCKKCRVTDFDFKEIKIFLCNHCGSYNYKNKWQKFHDLNDVVKIAVLNSVKGNITYKKLGEEQVEELLSYKAGVHKPFTVQVSIGKETFDLPAVIDVTLCPKCCKQGTKYFEGVLQVRNINPEIYAFIKNDLAKNRSKGVHINKETNIDDSGINIDFYYTDKGYLRIIAEKLRSSFGAIVKQNAQLFSIDWETSKNLYRLNVLVEFPKYHKSDVIKLDGHLYKIVSMDNKIHVMNLETKTKTLLPHKDSYDILKPVEVMLIKKYPEYEILDPTTYYQARLMNPNPELEINQKLNVIVDGGEAWIV